MFGIFAIAVLLTALTVSCDRPYLNNHTNDTDSTYITAIVNQSMNPEFTDLDTFMKYCDQEIECDEFICLLRALEPQTRLMISQRILSACDKITISSFVQEYDLHKDIYEAANIINATHPNIPKQKELLDTNNIVQSNNNVRTSTTLDEITNKNQ